MEACWRLQLVGELQLTNQGEFVKPRTRHDLVLVALLIAKNEPVARDEVVSLIWPDADPSRALGYLRNSLRALSKLGIEIDRPERSLSLDPGLIRCELSDARNASSDQAVPALEALLNGKVLSGLDSPARDTVEQAWREEVIKLLVRVEENGDPVQELQQRAQALGANVKTTHPARESQESRIARELVGSEWLIEQMLDTNPEALTELVARRGPAFAARTHPQSLFSLLMRIIQRTQVESIAFAKCLSLAGKVAHHLTQYTVAERMIRRSYQVAEKLDDQDRVAEAESDLGFINLELRRWDEAERLLTSAIQRARELGLGTNRSGHLLNNLAGLRWHQDRVEEALDTYEEAYGIGDIHGQEIAATNHAMIRAMHQRSDRKLLSLPQMTARSQSFQEVFTAMYRWAELMADGSPKESLPHIRSYLITASDLGYERLMSAGIDCAAISLAAVDRQEEGAGWVRVGSVARRTLGHGRSPGERTIIRTWLKGPFFGPIQGRVFEGNRSRELPDMGRQLARILPDS